MINKCQNSLFIPSFEEWAKYYTQWYDKMAKSLGRFGRDWECREAVHEAFLKAMGLSDHLHLREKLEPKTESYWFGFLRNQAKGILSNYHRFGNRFVAIKDYELDDEADDEPGMSAQVERIDQEKVHEEVRQIIKTVCADAGVNVRHVCAFIRFVLDEASGRTVVKEIPEIHNTNNLYQIRSRIMNLLRTSSDKFVETFQKLLAA